MSFNTPILLIVFNRPVKTQNLFEIIKKLNQKDCLFLLMDQEKSNQI